MTAQITVKMDNAAFAETPATELARILRDLADSIEAGELPESVRLRDANGNTVGHFTLSN